MTDPMDVPIVTLTKRQALMARVALNLLISGDSKNLKPLVNSKVAEETMRYISEALDSGISTEVNI